MSEKLTIKRAIGGFLFNINLLFKTACPDEGFRTLNYHSITDRLVKDEFYQMTTPKELFEDHIRYLAENGYRVVPCADVVNKMAGAEKISPDTICITFDDGFKDNLTNAAPILKKYGFKATIFLTVDFIGSGKTWLDWDEVREILKTGVFLLGSHSLSHRNLDGLNPDELYKEIAVSKDVLEDRLKIPIDLFAYPFGSYGSFNKTSKDMVRSKGYKAGFTSIAGWNSSKSDPYAIRKTRISWFDDGKEFQKELSGAYDWYRIWQKASSIWGRPCSIKTA